MYQDVDALRKDLCSRGEAPPSAAYGAVEVRPVWT